MSSPFLDALNEKQKEAVTYADGACLIVAGPGSGKTRTLTCRIAWLISEKNIPAKQLLAMTFTNKAANEMKKRVIQLLPNDSDLPKISTFHSFCHSVLREHQDKIGMDTDFVIIDEKDQKDILSCVLEKHKQKIPIDLDTKKAITSISCLKNQGYMPETVEDTTWALLYKEYQNLLRQRKAMDFDDLLLYTNQLFEQHSEIIQEYQKNITSLLIDEFQDLNSIQYTIAHKLAQTSKNICVVGDPDQTIYTFRGADLKNFERFQKDFPSAKTIILEQSYRCTPIILQAADGVITQNKKRLGKKMWTEKTGEELLNVFSFTNELDEAKFLSKEIKNRIGGINYLQFDRNEIDPATLNKNHSFSDFAVLYRSHFIGNLIEDTLRKDGIPYQRSKQISLLERKEVKALIAYARIMWFEHDDESLKQIINAPPRNIGEKTVESIEKRAKEIEKSMLFTILNDPLHILETQNRKAVHMFADLIRTLKEKRSELPPSHFLRAVLEESGLNALHTNIPASRGLRHDLLLELITLAAQFDADPQEKALSNFLNYFSCLSEQDLIHPEADRVSLLSVHGAKGLEFPIVFVAGVEEGLFPKDEQIHIEEERRLFYVAMTRAQDELYFLHAKERSVFGETQQNKPSRFLHEIRKELLEEKEAKAKPMSKRKMEKKRQLKLL